MTLSERMGVWLGEALMFILMPVISGLLWIYVLLDESHKWLYNIDEDNE